MKWIRDFEKRYLVFVGIGFWWALCWIAITWLTQLWINLPSDNELVMFFGAIMLNGFIFFQGYGICVLIRGFYLDLKDTWRRTTSGEGTK